MTNVTTLDGEDEGMDVSEEDECVGTEEEESEEVGDGEAEGMLDEVLWGAWVSEEELLVEVGGGGGGEEVEEVLVLEGGGGDGVLTEEEVLLLDVTLVDCELVEVGGGVLLDELADKDDVELPVSDPEGLLGAVDLFFVTRKNFVSKFSIGQEQKLTKNQWTRSTLS